MNQKRKTLLMNCKKTFGTLCFLTVSIALTGCADAFSPMQTSLSDSDVSAHVNSRTLNAIPAIANPAGDIANLAESQAREFEENSTPIDTEDVVFSDNEGLSASEVDERTLQMAEEYEVGEPLSAEDLEFFRAYLLPDTGNEATPTVMTAGYTPTHVASDTDSSSSYIQPALAKTIGINRSKSKLGSSVSQVGSLKLKVTEPGPFDNSWSTNFTAKRTGGKKLTKIKCQIKVQAYGAVTAWPFVGKIADISRSSTSPANAQTWTFSRSGPVAGALLGMEAQTYAYFWNSSGTFQLP